MVVSVFTLWETDTDIVALSANSIVSNTAVCKQQIGHSNAVCLIKAKVFHHMILLSL